MKNKNILLPLILLSLLALTCSLSTPATTQPTITLISINSPTSTAMGKDTTLTSTPTTHIQQPATPTLSSAPTQTSAPSGLQINPPGITSTAIGEHIALLHRSGQTFITWDERPDLKGASYRVYRSSQPITKDNLGKSTRLYEVWDGTAVFYANYYNAGGEGSFKPRYTDRYIIENGGSPLKQGTGLLVWTLSAGDFAGGTAGKGYYAVTVIPPGKDEMLDAGYALGPVDETVADPLPVEAPINIGAGGHLYIQYMNLAEWNPTFHAPNPTNIYYGLNSEDPALKHIIQYAYDYAVYQPTADACGGSIPEHLPVVFNLHGHADNTYEPKTENPDPWFCAYMIYPVDETQTWYFGFAKNFDYRQEGQPTSGDTIVNYTEQRLLRMVYDLIRQPPGPAVDTQRIYIYGHSMGGSGTLAFALRYPNVFAAAYASEPMTNYLTSGDGGNTDWRPDVITKWGDPQLNLPVKIIAPANWADRLQAYNGTGVWDWQNHQKNLQTRRGDDMVPFGVGHGMQDTAIEWPTQGKPAYAIFNAGRRAWGGAVTNDDHVWLSFQGLPPSLGVDDNGTPFATFQVIRDESVPGMSNCSADSAIPPTGVGTYNATLLWSSSWNPWDGAPLDTPEQWQISLCAVDAQAKTCGTGKDQTVDITPRRLQRFKVVPGTAYTWENIRLSDGSLLASGKVTADADGTVTIPSFQVSPSGDRLRLYPAGSTPPAVTATQAKPVASTETPAPEGTPVTGTATSTAVTQSGSSASRLWVDTTRGIHVFNDQLSSSMSDAQRRFAVTHYDGTQKMTRSDADLLRALNPNFVILNYRLGIGLGYQGIQNGCEPSGDWLKIIMGDEWVQEYPGDAAVKESWFYHYPTGSSTRVLNCDWGWYLADLNDSGWRQYWQGEVLRQVQANGDDGVFMDSLSVPNFLGYDHFRPALPDLDTGFEAEWTQRINDWLTWLKSQPLGRYMLIPNAGAWINSRDVTDYGIADGVMVEGFAMEADVSPYALSDWQLQMNRALGLISRDKIVIGQTSVTGDQERMFTLGSYLLIKGKFTYLNIEVDLPPEWFPEYDIPIGTPQDSAGTDIQTLYDAKNKVYRRNFDNGFVLVNPTNPFDDSGVTVTIDLGGTYYLAQTSGGGEISEDGVPTGKLTYSKVTQITLGPYSAAVLLNQKP